MTSDSLGPFGDLAAIGAVFARTRGVLDVLLSRGSVSDEAETVLSDASLPHIESVEAAFRARLRAGDVDLEQLRDLVRLGGLGPPPPPGRAGGRAALIEAIQALSGAGGERRLVRPVGRDLAALDHAQLAMALVPRTAPRGCPLPRLGELRRHQPTTDPDRVRGSDRGGGATPLARGGRTRRGAAEVRMAARLRVLRHRGDARLDGLRARLIATRSRAVGRGGPASQGGRSPHAAIQLVERSGDAAPLCCAVNRDGSSIPTCVVEHEQRARVDPDRAIGPQRRARVGRYARRRHPVRGDAGRRAAPLARSRRRVPRPRVGRRLGHPRPQGPDLIERVRKAAPGLPRAKGAQRTLSGASPGAGPGPERVGSRHWRRLRGWPPRRRPPGWRHRRVARAPAGRVRAARGSRRAGIR